MGNTNSGNNLVYSSNKDSSNIGRGFRILTGFQRIYAEEVPANDEEIEDPVEQMLKKTGCLEKHYSVLECIAESKDWRKCQQQVKDFKECMDKHKNRSTNI